MLETVKVWAYLTQKLGEVFIVDFNSAWYWRLEADVFVVTSCEHKVTIIWQNARPMKSNVILLKTDSQSGLSSYCRIASWFVFIKMHILAAGVPPQEYSNIFQNKDFLLFPLTSIISGCRIPNNFLEMSSLKPLLHK